MDFAGDIRSRVIADCAALLPLARDACAAMDEEDETEVLRLFCGESQKRTLRRLERLIDDLRLCRTAADLPGQEPVVLELRNAAFRVFRGLSVRVGNPLDLTKLFRSGAVDFFRMLTRRDPMLLQLVRRGLWRRFAYGLLFAAIKANQCLLKLRQMPAAFLRPFLVLTTGTGRIFRSVRSVRKHADELSQEQVARDFGITRMAVYRWEKNQTADGPDNTSNKFGYYRGTADQSGASGCLRGARPMRQALPLGAAKGNSSRSPFCDLHAIPRGMAQASALTRCYIWKRDHVTFCMVRPKHTTRPQTRRAMRFWASE